MEVPLRVTVRNGISYYDVGLLEEFPTQLGKTVHLPGQDVAVFRLSDGTIHALENRTAHGKGGPLTEGMVSGAYVYCPLRDVKISLVTGEVQAPDTGRVRIFPVSVTEGRVLIGLPA